MTDKYIYIIGTKYTKWDTKETIKTEYTRKFNRGSGVICTRATMY